MTTTADLIADTKRHLYSGETRDERDQISAGIDADDVGLGLVYGRRAVQAGVTLAIDLEELHVWGVESGINVTVSRGENGSTAAAHATGAHVYINPRFSAFSIFRALNQELYALRAEGLYRVRTLDFSYAPGTDAYDLTGVTDIEDIEDVSYSANDGTSRWARLPREEWVLHRDLPTSSFASGTALVVNGYIEPGTVRVAYRSGFSPLATTADDVAAVSGLPATAHDILPLGAAIRLTVGNEISRNSLEQYETRRADEVQAGARLGQMRMLMAQRAQRIADEKARLYARNPLVRR